MLTLFILKKNHDIFFLLILFLAQLQASEIEIKGLRTYSAKNEILPPIIIYNDRTENGVEDSTNDYIVIEFDVVSILKPNLQIIFQLCDKNWNPVDNIFLQNFGKDRFYNLQFTSAPTGVKSYNYSFKQTFPDERGQITFPFSGKYRYLITEFNNEKKIYGIGYFIVVYQNFKTITNLYKEVIDDTLHEIIDFNRRHKIHVDVYIPKGFDVSRQNEIEIIQNQKFFNSYFINFDLRDKYQYGRYLGINIKRYIKRDIFPVNEYRQVNLMDYNKYPNDKLLTSFDGVEVTRKFFFNGSDYDGGMKYYRSRDIYNEYLTYKFELTLPSNNKSVYLIGSFNNWKLDEKFKMNKVENYYSLIVSLKRGIYDYQYVTVQGNNDLKEINWIDVEGNHWNTTNTYYILVYYKDPSLNDWDKIVAISEVKSN